jgi:deoxyadenosine/deoxycytidine kinase
MNELRYIVVEGVIGAGKTSLARKLAEKLNAQVILEQFELNPFLEQFYLDQNRYAFQTQMFFLINRYKQQQDLHQGNLFSEYLVSDYLFDKDRIFAYLTLRDEELKLYDLLFPELAKNLRRPDLVIFLQCDVDRLMYNINQRNRDIESTISRKYIQDLADAYDKFFFKYNQAPLLIIDSSNIDFVNNQSDYLNLEREIFRRDRSMIEYLKPQGSISV